MLPQTHGPYLHIKRGSASCSDMKLAKRKNGGGDWDGYSFGRGGSLGRAERMYLRVCPGDVCEGVKRPLFPSFYFHPRPVLVPVPLFYLQSPLSTPHAPLRRAFNLIESFGSSSARLGNFPRFVSDVRIMLDAIKVEMRLLPTKWPVEI